MVPLAPARTSALAVLLFAVTASAQTLNGPALVQALQHGGYNIVMRHASSPMKAPDKLEAEPDNPNGLRQLDEKGKASAAKMGDALRALKIPIGEVLSSPTYRALETAHFAKLPEPRLAPELGETIDTMQPTSQEQTNWLRQRVTQFPSGTNTLLITQSPNLVGAFPQQAKGIAEGEALIFGPDGKGGATLVARVKIDDWAKLKP